MARRPINLTAIHGHATPRDAIWASVRKLRRFTLPELERDSGCDRSTVRVYAQSLCSAGYLDLVEKGPRRLRGAVTNRLAGDTYELVKDCGVEPPRVNRQGEKVTQGTKRRQIWQSIRILHKGFTVNELVMTSSSEDAKVSKVDAQQYCQKLARAGYLKKLQPSIPARYRLLPKKDTGPKPPQVQKGGSVFDPNLNAVVYTPEGGAK